MKIYAKHEAYDHRIGKIVKEMRTLGRPILKAVEYKGDIFAIEGSHRLASADYLGLSPIIKLIPVESDDKLDMFWSMVKDRLPVYEFDNIEIIRE